MGDKDCSTLELTSVWNGTEWQDLDSFAAASLNSSLAGILESKRGLIALSPVQQIFMCH